MIYTKRRSESQKGVMEDYAKTHLFSFHDFGGHDSELFNLLQVFLVEHRLYPPCQLHPKKALVHIYVHWVAALKAERSMVRPNALGRRFEIAR